ncbi:FAD-dependent monooxygenase [Luminiphilus sp.]|nr:FAD-dependent monooxygenase [Luminiphilus sp.]MDA9988275.1 FAD-dependent monooxygenase [Luminiphilus sp.]
MSDSQVTIIGAGPSGLTLAWWLVERGVSVTILERETAIPRDMRASTFHPATLDLLTDSGLATALIERGTVVPQWQYLIHESGERAVFNMAYLSEATAYPFRLQCEQFQLTELLAEKLAKQPLCELRLGATLQSVIPGESQVTVQYQSAGEDSVNVCDWLIAADGASSQVRKSLGLEFDGQTFPKTSITLVLEHPFEDDIPNLLGVNYVWLPDRHYSLMRLRDTWRLTYSPEQDQDIESALSDAVAQTHIARVSPRASGAAILTRNYYTLHQRCLARFCHGRTLFIGDAAHLNSPAGGMGMNSGIHDARSLADHLVPVINGEDPLLLERYDRRRRTIAQEEVQRLSARNYARHRETEASKRVLIWNELQEIVSDPVKHRDFLLDAAMIRSREREMTIE